MDLTHMHAVDSFSKAGRALRRAPAFTAIGIITFAIGIGASVAMFTAFSAVLVRPLPFANADRLVRVRIDQPGRKLESLPLSAPEYERFAAEVKSLTSTGAWTVRSALLQDGDNVVSTRAIHASPTLLATLGVQLRMGRGFARIDAEPGAPPVALISEEFWRSRFNGDPQIVGRSMELGAIRREIIGILPAGLRFPPLLEAPTADVWLPLAFTSDEREAWGRRNYGMIGRLRSGRAPDDVRTELERYAAIFALEHPRSHPRDAQWRPAVTSVTLEAAGSMRVILPILLGAVALVFVVSCANVASLFVVRAARRRQDAAVRLALGGDRMSLAGSLVAEAVVVATFGGVAGVAGAAVALEVAQAHGVSELPWLAYLTIDWRVAAFAVLAAAAAAIACAMAPLASLRLVTADEAMRASRRTTAGRHERRAQRSLITIEVAIAVVLLSGAGLLSRTLSALNSVDPGFETERVFTIPVAAPTSRYPDSVAARSVLERAVAAVRSMPNVEAAGATNALPLTGGDLDWGFLVEGVVGAGAARDNQVRVVVPGYFEAMRVRVVAGRTFTDADRAGSPPVVVVNESFARTVWPGEQAIGRRISYSGPPGEPTWATVVGVVRDSRDDGLDAPVVPIYYAPLAQVPGLYGVRALQIVARSAPGVAPRPIMDAAQRVVHEETPGQPTPRAVTMASLVSNSIGLRRFIALLLTAFSASTLAIVIVGIFALLATAAEARASEFGVRLALGAQPGEVFRLLIREAGAILFVGSVAGVIASLALARVIRSQLYGVSATDPINTAVSLAVLTTAALLACIVPALRTARVNVADVMRRSD